MNILFPRQDVGGPVVKSTRLLWAVALSVALTAPGRAQTWTQTGTGTFSWNTAANWNTGVPNSAGATALFTTTSATTTQTVTLDAAITLGSLDLTNTTTSYTFTNGTGGSFLFNNGGATAASIGVGAGALAQTINASIAVAASQTGGLAVVNNSSNALTLGGTIDNGGNPLAINGSGNTTISGIISGAGALTKNGAGNLTLTGLNTLSGGYTINAGTLTVTSTTTNGPGTIRGTVTVNAGATLLATTANAFGYNAGAKVDVLNVNGGTVTSTTNGDQGWAVTYNLTGATLNTSGGTNAVFAMGGGSAINVLASANPTTFNGQIRLRETNTNDTLVITVADGAAAVDLNMAAVVSTNNASRILTKDGPGLMQMTAQNTYTGPTNILAGTLQIGDGTTSGGLASATIVNNATLILNPGTGASVVSGVLSGTGALNKIGPNTATIGGANAYAGPVNVNAGTLRVRPTATATVAGTVTVAAGATLGIVPFNTTTAALSVGTLTLGGATGGNLNFELVGVPTVAPLTVTTLTTAGTNTVIVSSSPALAVGQFPLVQYTGTIGGGGFAGLTAGLPPHVTGSLVNNTGAGTVDLNVTAVDTIRWTGATNGTWDINTTQNWRTVTGGAATNYLQPFGVGDVVTFDDQATGNFTITVAAPVTPAAVTVNNTTNAYTLGGAAIGGTFNLVKSGTGALTVTNDNTYTGGTTINAGTVNVGNGGTTGALGTGNIVNNGALVVNRSNDLTIGGVISGTGTVTKQGAGTLTLSNAGNSYAGNLTISAGTLTTGAQSTTASANTALGNKDPGRVITVAAGGTLSFTVNNVFAGSGASAASLPSLVVAGTLSSTRYNAIPNITLNGGTLTQNPSDSGSYFGYQFLGSVTVGGSTPSTIATTANPAKGNHLLPAGTTFTVADVTGNSNPSLLVSAPLLNGSGDYAGAAGLTKAGAGIMALSGVNTYTGPTTITAGTLAVGVAGTGSITSPVTVNTGGTLAGSGTVSGSVDVASGGTVAPGNSPGKLTVAANGTTASNVTFASGSSFRVELNGNTAGTGHDQLVLSSTAAVLNLGGATLNASLGYTPAAGDRLFIIVQSDAGSTVTGQFAQGTSVTIGGFSALVSYAGDSGTNAITGGNDVVLYNFTPVPEPVTVLGLAGAGLGLAGYVRRRRR